MDSHECARRFPLRIPGVENIVKPEKFLLTSPSADSIKCVATLLGDNICQADIVLKVFKHTSQTHKTHILPDSPWKLQQIQDAGNHLLEAMEKLSSRGTKVFSSGAEVVQLMAEIMGCLIRGRSGLVMPKKKTIEELMHSPNMVRC
ncbi:PREDICTED: protein rogdi-like [Priapulus caudatus]|uniref:Protein rogdi-like n=1 Tax=Priapulus caudatus TaxID=37621 RepID=A0ABM1EZ20_PRICU|nr:PREDICTED: protein rogdi-like [Priapulus caudatus]